MALPLPQASVVELKLSHLVLFRCVKVILGGEGEVRRFENVAPCRHGTICTVEGSFYQSCQDISKVRTKPENKERQREKSEARHHTRLTYGDPSHTVVAS